MRAFLRARLLCAAVTLDMHALYAVCFLILDAFFFLAACSLNPLHALRLSLRIASGFRTLCICVPHTCLLHLLSSICILVFAFCLSCVNYFLSCGIAELCLVIVSCVLLLGI